jgi:Spy/CpxP family protein refolding chaperone
VTLGLLGATALAWAPRQQAQPASPTPSPTSIDEVLTAVRADMQGSSADIMAKNLTLTSEQAAKFWPVFQKYQAEQSVIMDAQLKGIQKYIESYDTLDGASAASLINAHLDRDAKMVALRQKWFGEFQKVLDAKTAARVIQIDRRLSLVHQLAFTEKIPLIH